MGSQRARAAMSDAWYCADGTDKIGRRTEEVCGQGAYRGVTMKPLAVIAVTLLSWSPALAQTTEVEKARLARTMWSAFQCATYAELSKDQKEQERLFLIGVKAGRDFLEALKNGQISRETASNEVPIGVIGLLGGPSPDFIVGRVFENATRDAYDQIVSMENGLLLEHPKWVMDEELRKTKAESFYQSRNCILVK
jgi:hypothetical protein